MTVMIPFVGFIMVYNGLSWLITRPQTTSTWYSIFAAESLNAPFLQVKQVPRIEYLEADGSSMSPGLFNDGGPWGKGIDMTHDTSRNIHGETQRHHV